MLPASVSPCPRERSSRRRTRVGSTTWTCSVMVKVVKCVVSPTKVQLSPLARMAASSRVTPVVSQFPSVSFQNAAVAVTVHHAQSSAHRSCPAASGRATTTLDPALALPPIDPPSSAVRTGVVGGVAVVDGERDGGAASPLQAGDVDRVAGAAVDGRRHVRVVAGQVKAVCARDERKRAGVINPPCRPSSFGSFRSAERVHAQRTWRSRRWERCRAGWCDC